MRALTVLIAILTASPALAQSEPPKPAAPDAPTVAVKIDEVARHASVSVYESNRGNMVETLQVAGKKILRLRYSLLASWTEKGSKRINLKHEQIVLTGAGDKPLKSLGKLDWGTNFKPSSFGIYLSRPYRWKAGDAPKPSAQSAFFLIPEDAKELTLKVGEMAEAKVIVPQEDSPELDPTSFLGVSIRSAKLLDKVANAIRVGRDSLPTVVTNRGGKMLEVQLEIKALKANIDNGVTFWLTGWLTVDVNGVSVAPLGEKFMGRLSNNVSHNDRPGGDPKVVTFYFPVPADAKLFKLRLLGREVAGGRIAE